MSKKQTAKKLPLNTMQTNRNNEKQLNPHIFSFFCTLQRDWEENRTLSFIYNYFKTKCECDEKRAKKAVSDFFYNIKSGRSVSLTLPLLIDYCDKYHRTPDELLDFNNVDPHNILNEIESIKSDLLLPLKTDGKGFASIVLEVKNGIKRFFCYKIDIDDLYFYDDANDVGLYADLCCFDNFDEAMDQYNDYLIDYSKQIEELKIYDPHPDLLKQRQKSKLSSWEDKLSVDEHISQIDKEYFSFDNGI